VVCFFLDSLLGDGGSLLGNLLALTSGVTYSVVFMMKVLPGSDNLSSIFVGCALGAVIGVPTLVQETDFSPPALGAALALGMIQYALAYICIAEGLEKTPPVAASLIATVEPILNPILTAVLLGETLGTTALLGAAIVVLGIIGYNYLKARYPVEPT